MAAGSAAARRLPGAVPLKRCWRALVLPFAAASLGAAAACSGVGGPRPRPVEPTDCTLLWYRAREGGRFDLYKVEMPAADWAPGTRSYDGVVRLGVFYYGLSDADGDGLFEQHLDAASATSGTFTVGGSGLDEGDTVTFEDTVAQSYFGLGDALLATGGTGVFDGVWSPSEIEEGEGEPAYAEGATLTLAYAGSSLELGSDSYAAFGYCWADPAVANAGAAMHDRLWRPDPRLP